MGSTYKGSEAAGESSQHWGDLRAKLQAKLLLAMDRLESCQNPEEELTLAQLVTTLIDASMKARAL
jgi:hypothetical protein